MIDPKDILILCCWFKKNVFFEDTLKRLWDAGFKNIWLIQTSEPTFGHYEGPYSKFLRAPLSFDRRLKYTLCSWTDALVVLQRELLASGLKYEYIFLIDDDLFFTDTIEFLKTTEEVVEGQYDHVSRFRMWNRTKEYDWKDRYIVEVPEITFTPGSQKSDLPQPHPSFSTGWEYFSRRYWEDMTRDDLSYWGKMIRSGVRRKLKFGAQKCVYGQEHDKVWDSPIISERAWGDEWFHLARLTSRCIGIDILDDSPPPSCSFRSGHGPDLYRMGFFAKQEEIYGKIYPARTQDKIERVYNILGDRDICLSTWNTWVQGTPMENWSKYD